MTFLVNLMCVLCFLMFSFDSVCAFQIWQLSLLKINNESADLRVLIQLEERMLKVLKVS